MNKARGLFIENQLAEKSEKREKKRGWGWGMGDGAFPKMDGGEGFEPHN